MRLAATLALSLALATASLPALADEVGDKALAAVDAASNKAKTQILVYDFTTKEDEKAEKHGSFELRVKGAKRFLELTSPADLKGTKLLVESPAAMYVFLPAFGKVRRIATGLQDGFMGMAVTLDDIATEKLGAGYTATADETTDAEVKLTLVPKAGTKTRWSKIRMTVSRDKNIATELKYLDAAGKLLRTDTRSAVSCEGDVCSAGKRVIVDHAKSITTTLTRKSWKVNPEISDDVFSKRNLGE